MGHELNIYMGYWEDEEESLEICCGTLALVLDLQNSSQG